MNGFENIMQFVGLKRISGVERALKDPLMIGTGLTLIILLAGGLFYSSKARELKRITEEVRVAADSTAQKEKSVHLLRLEVQKILARSQQKSRSAEYLTANERKMSQVLEKMALSAAGRGVDVVSFRPESLQEGEKDTLLTVKVKIKTTFGELEKYLSRIDHFPQPVKVAWIRIETLESETPYIYAELRVMTRIKKEGAGI